MPSGNEYVPLAIPASAASLLAGELPRLVELDTGTECTWNIRLMKHYYNGPRSLLLDEGWPDIAEKHGFKAGCVGQFEVVHPHYLKVRFFERDGVEITYGHCFDWGAVTI
jgi:hypothetical protein